MTDEVRDAPTQIVAIGGSAGGLSALGRFFDGVPPDSGVAYVAILHLSPDRESQLSEILDRRASIPVMEVTESVAIEPDRVYVISPRSQLEISGSELTVKDLPPGRPRMPVDRFFRSLAKERGARAAGVVMSGTGRDGSLGLRAIREKGGITAAQEPDDADYPEMPRSAITEGRAEVVLPADELAAEVLRILSEEGLERVESEALPDEAKSAVDRVVARVGSEFGHDLSRFRRSTLLRRLDRRMRFSQIASIDEYARRIEDDEAERQALFQDLLISVSHFFRDPEAFAFVERRVVPDLFEGKKREDQVRVWVPGCATGEEAYSLAMLLHERATRLDSPPEVQIFATDIDENALSFARRAHYPESVADDVSPARMERYFDRDNSGYRIVKPIRDMVLFAVHGVLRDPPFSQLDLVSCRNLLIYLEPGAQKEVLERFHYALRPGGYLFLGASETVGPDFFQPVAKKERIYRRGEGSGSIPVSRRHSGDGLPDRGREDAKERDREPDRRPEASSADLHGRLLRRHGPPSVVVNAAGEIIHSSETSGRYLRHPGGDPTNTLLDIVSEPFIPTLRTAIYRAFEHDESSRRTVEAEIDGESRGVDVVVRPSTGSEGRYALVLFEERATARESDPVAGPENEAIRALQADLEDTRDQLQATIEEREATIEELQAANEELQSVNEEHQATEEELETRREELQSVNEELTTINQEHRITIEELGEVNADLRNLMESTQIATIFLDEKIQVRRFTESATDLFNLLPNDEGRPFAHITHNLNFEEPVLDLIREVIDNRDAVTQEVWNENGRCFVMGIHPYVSRDEKLDGAVLTFFDITDRKRMENDVRRARSEAEAERRRLLALMDHLPAGVMLLEAESRRILSANQRARKILWDDPESDIQWDAGAEATHELPEVGRWPIDRAIESGEAVLEEELSIELAGGGHRHLLVNAAPIEGENGDVKECVVAMVDIEEVLRQAREKEAERTRERVMDTVSTVSHEFRTPVNAILGYTQLLTDGIPEPLPKSQVHTAERIMASTRHLNFMVEQILTYSQLEEGRQQLAPQEVDPEALARDVASILEHEAQEKGLSLRVETGDGTGTFVTDPDKLRQVLMNLIQNAVKFTEEGEVVVTVSNGEDGEAVFVVRDTGVGIDPADQERIFERFEKASRRHPSGVQSTGLGLAIVRDLIHRLGGVIELESEPGKGSVFRIRVPHAPESGGGGDEDSP